jgi:arylsulfatase A-like enzyme
MTIIRLSLVILAAAADPTARDPDAGRPNVVLIVADDQGYGDVGWNGNARLKTPRLDRLAREGAVVPRFYVSPVCAPTRASLLTGRYAYRTRVVDTYQGRAMMEPAEVTLAEHLAGAGYRCGSFGKWHLGDSAPMRAIDQGFHRAVVHRGGGIGQPSDPPEAPGYFDPVLLDNGVARRFRGYCSDIYADLAVEFVRQCAGSPFFVYLAFNAPHVPLEIADHWADPYRNLAAEPGTDSEVTGRVYGMIANIDANVGKLLDALDEVDVNRQTLVLYMTDNGPQQARFNSGLRGLKGSVYEGGIRAPFAARWPGRIPAGRRIAAPLAHIDITPTVLEACGVSAADHTAFDGRSVWALLDGTRDELPDRPYFVQWHRGDVPERGRACAVVTQSWKLAQASGVEQGSPIVGARWELFDLEADSGETVDLIEDQPAVAAELKAAYERWFVDVSATRGFEPPAIDLGSEREPRSILTIQDRRGDPGYWAVNVARAGDYRVGVTFTAVAQPSRLVLEVGGARVEQSIAAQQRYAVFEDLRLCEGRTRLMCGVEKLGENSATSVIQSVLVEHKGD